MSDPHGPTPARAHPPTSEPDTPKDRDKAGVPSRRLPESHRHHHGDGRPVEEPAPAAVSPYLAKLRLARILVARGCSSGWRTHASRLVAEPISQAENALGGTASHHGLEPAKVAG